MTFNDRLTAIGGWQTKVGTRKGTRKVEVYEGGYWNYQKIQSIGNKDGRLYQFTALVIKHHTVFPGLTRNTVDHLYVFGNIL